jgi:glutathione S-transferase
MGFGVAVQLTLYYAPIACSLVSYITLTEAGADFSVRPLNFGRREHHEPEFLKINPRHRVPVLLIDGQPLLETLAIQLWVARQFPAARLLPEDPMQQLQAVSRMAWCASGIHPCLTPNALPERYCDLPESEESVRRCARKLLVENYRVADGLLAGRDWFFEHFTAVDAYFFWCFRRGRQFGLDVSAFEHCLAHFDRMSERASVRQLLAYEAEVLEAFRRSA